MGSWSRSGRWRIRIGNRRRGVDNLKGTVLGGAEIGAFKFQYVRFGQKFLSIEVGEEFQIHKIIT